MGIQKIAVLGSGAAALSAVHELTREPDWKERYEITVYQLGWRCGGKARSGRNRERHHRIEEHGLHILLGFYAMTFRLLFDTYEYVEQHGIGCGAPFGGVKRAIRQAPSWQLQERFEGESPEWRHWPLRFARNRLYPGEEGRERRDFFLFSFVRAAFGAGRRTGSGGGGAPAGALRRTGRRLGKLVLWLLCLTMALPALVVVGKLNSLYQRRATLGRSPARWRRAFYTTDLMCAMLRGMIANYWLLQRPDHEGYRQLDDEDYRDWLRRHGLTEVSAQRSPMLENLYKTIAHNTSSLAAGAALYTTSRLMFSWTGCPQYLMNAGMGDVVVAPIYQTLRHRGVRFEFFHRVENLRLSEDQSRIEAVEMVRQCRMKDPQAEYEPLIPVQGQLERPLDCWPSEPLWEQIQTEVDGVDLRELPEDQGLESFHPIPGETDATLHAGRDFDIVLNGIAIGAHATIGAELMRASPEYREFVERGVRNAVAPAGGQVWLRPSTEELGWSEALGVSGREAPGTPLCGTYLDPIGGYTDMSQVLAAEDFAGEEAPRSLAYFWGEQEDIAPEYRSETGIDHAGQLADYLEGPMRHFWPRAFPEGTLDWDRTLFSPRGSPNRGRDRVRDQYVTELPSSSDLYNRVPRASTATRLRAGSLFDRWGLVLAGDFVRTRFNIALVEGAVESGIRAANVIRGRPETHRTIG